MNFNLLSFYSNSYDSEWHIGLLNFDLFMYGGELDKSLLSVGKKGDIWIIDLMFFRVTPRV